MTFHLKSRSLLQPNVNMHSREVIFLLIETMQVIPGEKTIVWARNGFENCALSAVRLGFQSRRPTNQRSASVQIKFRNAANGSATPANETLLHTIYVTTRSTMNYLPTACTHWKINCDTLEILNARPVYKNYFIFKNDN